MAKNGRSVPSSVVVDLFFFVLDEMVEAWVRGSCGNDRKKWKIVSGEVGSYDWNPGGATRRKRPRHSIKKQTVKQAVEQIDKQPRTAKIEKTYRCRPP